MVRIILISKEFGKVTLKNSEFDNFVTNNKYILHSINEPAYQEIHDNLAIFNWYLNGELHRTHQPATYSLKCANGYSMNDVIDDRKLHQFRYNSKIKDFQHVLQNKFIYLNNNKCYLNGYIYIYDIIDDFFKKSIKLDRLTKLNTIINH